MDAGSLSLESTVVVVVVMSSPLVTITDLVATKASLVHRSYRSETMPTKAETSSSSPYRRRYLFSSPGFRSTEK